MARRLIRHSCALCCCVLFASFAAQALAGSIKGHVTAKEGRGPVVGANVSLPGTRFGTTTSAEGNFVITEIPAGAYLVRVGMIGFDKFEKNGVIVDADSSVVELDIVLKEEPVSMAEVVVRARANRELETSGRMTEQQANNIVNVITAQTIDRSTDRTAADVLQRVSGMSLIRDQGEGRYLVMRGLEQRYNNTLLNGIKIPSPESKDRYLPLDIFPSGLFERIEVTKALTPELAGDAIGGSTNLMLRDAPDRFLFSFGVAGGGAEGTLGATYSRFDPGSVPELDPDRAHGVVSDADPTTQLAPRYQPTSKDFSVNNLKFTDRKTPPDGLYSLLVGDREFDGRLGIIAAGSYQNTYNHVQTDFYSVSSDINTVDKEGHLTPYAATYDNRAYYTNRIRGGLSLKADFIADPQQQINATYLYVRQEEDQTRHAVQVTIDGSRGAADLTYTNRSALRTQDISSFSVGGDHFSASPFDLRWTFNYTDAVQDRPDEAEYSLYRNFDPYGNIQPFVGLGQITHSWRKNDDRQTLAKIDLTVHITDDGAHTLQVGGNGQKLNRVNFQNDYILNPAIINGRTQPFTSIDSTITVPFGFGSTSGTSVYGYQNYKADEYLFSWYMQYTWILGDLQVLAGVRWEQARDSYFTMAPVTVGENEAKVTTVDFLPGIHFRYAITPENIARLSLTQSMSRPSYFDLVPASDRSDNSQTQGNPNLKPAHSVNFDLRYEYYPNPADMISVGYYHKRITDPIEDEYQSVGIVFVTTKGNGNPATVDGFEGVVSKRIWDFAVTANYSHVISRITNTKLVPVIDVYGDPVIPVPVVVQTRPLQSQSPDIVNLSLSYLNPEWGTMMNVSYNYTGRRLIAVAQIDGYDTYQDGVGELDASGEQTLIGNLKFNVKLINLLNSTVVTEVASGDYVKHNPIVIQREYNKFRGSVGLSFRL